MKYKHRFFSFTPLFIMIAAFNQAQAYEFPTHPHCPWRDKKVSWREYISNGPSFRTRFGSSGKITPFGVIFSNARRLNDSSRQQPNDPFGDVFTGSCYSVVYYQLGTWNAAGFSERVQGSASGNSTGGDPNKYELNIWGNIFTYNEAGELFHPSYGKVGKLSCFLSDQCKEYGIQEEPIGQSKGPAFGSIADVSLKTPLGRGKALVPEAGRKIRKFFKKPKF